MDFYSLFLTLFTVLDALTTAGMGATSATCYAKILLHACLIGSLVPERAQLQLTVTARSRVGRAIPWKSVGRRKRTSLPPFSAPKVFDVETPNWT